MARVQRIRVGARWDVDVQAWLDGLEHPHVDAVIALRAQILGVDPSVREGIKWNAGSFRTSEWFATFNLFGPGGPKPVTLVLHRGAKGRPDVRLSIPDPEGLLAWRGEDRALIAFADLAQVQARRDGLDAVLRAWIAAVG